MKMLLTAMTAIAALAAVPAAGQFSSRTNVDASVMIDNRISQLDARLQAGIRQGFIDRQEARSLRMQMRDLRRLRDQYGYNGLSWRERETLQQRIRTTREQMRLADGGRFDRDRRYAWDDDGYYGQGGVYEPIDCDRRGGIAGFFDNMFGDDDDDCSLRVGQRVPSNLYGVPSDHRDRYRDGNGVYYRSDGRSIYQVDARDNRVLRVYPAN